jgi:2-polyprenyl-3-methyl-5-hydroxy-6-metoxy-1,4-benzoquinol methylase
VLELSGGERQVQRSFNLEHARHSDSRYLHFTPGLAQQWLNDIKLPAEWFKGKTILDAGCGSGRWTYAMASLGARVVAADLTEAGTKVTQQATAGFENVAVLQANVFNLPFKPESFDMVVSWGVLHHTPSSKAAFDRLAPLVKRGGILYVMVYEKHNPLKFFLTDLIRRVLRRLPEDRRYRACRWLIIRNRLLHSLLANRIICALEPSSRDPLEISTLQLGLYDAYAPMFNHLHSRREVEAWFREHGFDQICLTRPVRFSSRKDIRLYGECGGSINMRGVRL